MFKNYIFDFGQVIVKFDPYYMTSKYVKTEKDIKLVSNVVFDRLYWDKLDEGSITDQEVIDAICERLPEYLHKNAISAYENWYLNIPLIDGMEEIILKLKNKGKRLFILSNISINFADNYHKNSDIKRIFDLFEGKIFSAKIGLTKPNEEIFKYILNKYDLKVDETIFIDDSIKNIYGAKKVGIHGYLFNNYPDDLIKNI